MANRLKGEASLGDKTLAFDFGAFIALEDKMGKKMPEITQMMQEGLGYSDVRDFVWAGLLKHHPQSEAEVVTFLNEIGYPAAMEAIRDGVNSHFDNSEAKDKNPPKAK